MFPALSPEDAEAAAADLRTAFEQYETALNTNDVQTLVMLFWHDPRVVRLTATGGAYGIDEIEAFRKGRNVDDVQRSLRNVQFLMTSPEDGIATCEYTRTGSGRTGAQTQVWHKFPEGWRIISAHVSLAEGTAS